MSNLQRKVFNSVCLLALLAPAAFAQTQTLRGTDCLPIDQQKQIADAVSRLLVQFNTDNDIARWKDAVSEREANFAEANDCSRRLSGTFTSIGASLEGCDGTIERYNGLVRDENNLMNTIRFKQQTLASQLRILRALYPACP